MRFIVVASIASACLGMSGAAHAQGFFDPPGKSFDLYSTDFNDGYNTGYNGRGVLFTVDEPIVATTYWWTNQVPIGTQLTWRLFEDGVVVDTQVSVTIDGGLADHRTPTNFQFQPGKVYDLNIMHEAEAGTANYFYGYDPAFFGDAPFNTGVFRIFDGELGGPGGTDNFVMPRFGIDVPTPGAGALLTLAGLAAARRRR